MSCEVCPSPEGRDVSKVVGARNLSECGGKNLFSTNKSNPKTNQTQNVIMLIIYLFIMLVASLKHTFKLFVKLQNIGSYCEI